MAISITKPQIDYQKYINYIIILYAFSIPISRAGITLFSVLMILLWIIEGDFKRKFNQLKNNKFIIAIGIYVLYTFLSLLWTQYESLSHGAGQSFKIVRLIILPMLVIATTIKKEYIEKVIFAFLMGMLISEILSYGIFFEWWQLKHGSPSDPTPFMHHLDYSLFLTFTSLLLLNRFFFTDDWRLKAFYFVYFLFATSNLFLNGGRTGHLAFAISIFVVGFVNIKNKFLAFFSMLILVVSIFYAAYHISPVFKQRFYVGAHEINQLEADTSSKYHGSFGQRLGAWIVGTEMIKDNHFFGTGAGSEMVEFKEYVKESAPEFHRIENIAHFHNEYVHNIVEYGVIGLILYLSFWYYLFKMKIPEKKFDNLKIIFIAVIGTSTLVELSMHNQFPMSLFALFVGILTYLNLNINEFSK